MESPTYLIDTNILSGILRKDADTVGRFFQAAIANTRLVLCPVVYYELRRGLMKKGASRQLEGFETLARRLEWIDLARADWERASELWAQRQITGRPMADADLLIAVQAERLGAILVTDNEKDFEGLGLRIENWRRRSSNHA